MANPTSDPGLNLRDALAGSEPLAALMLRVRGSRARFDAIAELIPVALRKSARAGPLDDAAWVLLADNAATAAKLRQSLPSLQQALAAAGWPDPPVKIKVRPRG
jgi:hypothetical protein